ncbi:DUF4177 domain-containing protein [Thalassovita sp.]|uniref:DUF4177 domain-containing protein n=1 Tax=Thalassovita sp. TaxID=1979401 RepID=UPI0028811539|nr:DUF4177 domain-containing protein [Thalassovita sp.]MDF1802757.1 DUF4177 domain-containing protein [Thalassovita sp.]
MSQYEYKVIPAPVKGLKAKGVRGHEARFANALQDVMNRMGAEGWEYQRAETLPSEERHGLTNVTTNYRNVLVFRRPLQGNVEDFQPRLLAAPTPVGGPPDTKDHEETPDSFFPVSGDNGVEDADDLNSPATSVLIARAERLKSAETTANTTDNADAEKTN